MRKITLEEVAVLENEIQRLRTMIEHDAAAFAWILDYVIEPHGEVIGNANAITQRIREIRAGKRGRDGCRVWTDEEHALVEEMSKRATPIDVSRFEHFAGEFGEVES
jgi:hypothetical protein